MTIFYQDLLNLFLKSKLPLFLSYIIPLKFFDVHHMPYNTQIFKKQDKIL